MTEVIKAVREAIQESRQTSLKVGEIFKSLQKKRMIVDRDELQTVLIHYSKLQIIMLDSEDNVIFL
jgi:ATP-dependent 26S proteasome regulatory subunit